MFNQDEIKSIIGNFGSLYLNYKHSCPLCEMGSFYNFLHEILLLKLIHLDIQTREIDNDLNYSRDETIEIQKMCLTEMEKLGQIKELVESYTQPKEGEWFNLFYKSLQVSLEIRLENLEAHTKTVTDPEQIKKLEIEKEKFTQILEYAKKQPCAVPLYTVKEDKNDYN